EGAKFQDSIPVSSGATGTKLLFDEGVCEPRAADTGRVDDVGLSTVSSNDLRARDRGLQCVYVLVGRRAFEKHDHEMAGIPLGLLGKWIMCDDRLPIRRRPNEELRLEIEPFGRLHL